MLDRLRSIRSKFLVIVVPLVLLAIVLVFGLFELNTERRAARQLQDRLDQLLEMQSAVLSRPLWNLSEKQIELIVSAIEVDESVIGVAVYDEADSLVAGDAMVEAMQDNTYYGRHEIVHKRGQETTQIGMLTVAFSDQSIVAERNERLLLVALLAIALMAATIASAMIAQRRIIGAPLERLLGSINLRRQGGGQRAVNWNSNDEMGVVITAFNEMLQRQEADEQTLELRVEERTLELATANERIGELNDQLAAENQRMGSELDVAKRLQEMMLPRELELQQVADLDIAGFMEPAEEVGGDYFDVLQHDDRVNISIADVSGHGLESGVVMLMLQTAVRALVTSCGDDQLHTVAMLNRTIYDNIQRMQVDKNASLLLIDYQMGKLNLCGQHEEVILFRANGQYEVLDTMEWGMPIGMLPDIKPELLQISINLQPGDGLILYTDGITEAENPEGNQYTLERLCETAALAWRQNADAIKKSIVNDVKSHIDTQLIYDDITLLVLKRM